VTEHTDIVAGKVLTIRQPWAWAILEGLKRIENRSWRTRYRGTLWIHAATSRATLKRYADRFPTIPSQLDFGAIIGRVQLIDCVPLDEAAGQPFAEGPWCWILASPEPITPRPCSGRLGLWTPPLE
jgi:hypothetical protein